MPEVIVVKARDHDWYTADSAGLRLGVSRRSKRAAVADAEHLDAHVDGYRFEGSVVGPDLEPLPGPGMPRQAWSKGGQRVVVTLPAGDNEWLDGRPEPKSDLVRRAVAKFRADEEET